jgi:hypothetical protein
MGVPIRLGSRAIALRFDSSRSVTHLQPSSAHSEFCEIDGVYDEELESVLNLQKLYHD